MHIRTSHPDASKRGMAFFCVRSVCILKGNQAQAWYEYPDNVRTWSLCLFKGRACIRNWEQMNTMVRYYDKSPGLFFPVMDSSWTILLKKAGQHVK
ncbi:hypothetical protein AWJ19_04435 [Paenibacillus sp. DMB5]|nr:hypothetical protein AWJ19_04435 [Paenibacillus sp. DMB5]